MSHCFIICEYNPLHSGHAYHIRQAKEATGGDVICIMSGNTVQRGELAVADKYTRAEWAIKAGADMVVELPAAYCQSPAQIFALGGVKIISRFAQPSYLCFGSEYGDVDLLTRLAATLTDNLQVDLITQSNLAQGLSYPQAYSLAVKAVCQTDDKDYLASLLDSPNNLLAIEYIKAIRRLNAAITPIAIKRLGSYNDMSVEGEFASASAIRNNLRDKAVLQKYCPSFVYDDLQKYSDCDDRLYAVLSYQLPRQDLSQICGVKEGIDNRILQKLDTCHDFSSFLQQVKTKRYPMAYIKRLLLNALTYNTLTYEELKGQAIEYVNVLAVKDDKKSLLSLFDCAVTTKQSDAHKLAKDEVQRNADLLYASVKYRYRSVMSIVKS
ncbi:MAG: nucleotidyltransferase family protein [Eubacteriales bacterium]|nr:nucleotidyltransferase family protein [Eubacteriales bacterium]